MLTVRSAHASYAIKALKEFVENESGVVSHVNLFKDEVKFPLGWSLSEAVTRVMDNQIDENEEIRDIIEYLKSPSILQNDLFQFESKTHHKNLCSLTFLDTKGEEINSRRMI